MIAAMAQMANSTQIGVGASSSSEGAVGLPFGMIGFVVLALIVVPVVILILSAIFGAPRNSRVPLLFLASVVIMISGTIIGFAAFGTLLGLVFPG